MKLQEIATTPEISTDIGFSCQCAAYNFPHSSDNMVEDTLNKEGTFSANTADEVKKCFATAVEAAVKLAKQHGFTIEINELEVGMKYAGDQDEEEDEDGDDREELSEFPRTGSNGQDYIKGEFTLKGPKAPDKNLMYEFAMEIGEALYGQYCDEADVEVLK